MSRSVIDLFAGIGGLSTGFERAGCRVLAGVEIDAELAHHYEINHRVSKSRGIAADVAALNPAQLLDEFDLQPGELDYLVGGSPCQGYSTQGKRRVNDARNDLIFQFPRYVQVLRPTAFVIENVPGLISLGDGTRLKTLLHDLRQAGYGNARFSIVNAAACGVPQNRRRILIYGTRGPALPNLEDLLEPHSPTTVWQAISDLPDALEAARRYEPGERIPYSPRRPSRYASLLRHDCQSVDRWEPVVHSSSIQSIYRRLGQGKSDPLTKCFRLDPKLPARSLLAGSRTRTACRPVHPFSPRVITVREAARLHSFPDNFVLPPRKSTAHMAIGNAVPPLMAFEVAVRFNQALNGS